MTPEQKRDLSHLIAVPSKRQTAANLRKWMHGVGWIDKLGPTQLLMNEVLPAFASDFATHKTLIAYILSYLRSYDLSTEIRNSIGLKENFTPTTFVNRSPNFLTPGKLNADTFATLCSESERHFNHLITGIDYPEYEFRQDENDILFDLFGCLMYKIRGSNVGLCYATTEFNNGSVFLKGMFYELVSWNESFNLKKIAHSKDKHKPNANIDVYDPINHNDPVYFGNTVFWNNPGGVWSPCRSVHRLSEREEPYYW